MKNKRLLFQIITGVLFLAALGYGVFTLSLIGHRPAIIFITEGFAILSLGVTFVYCLVRKEEKTSRLKLLTVITLLLFVIYGITELVCYRTYQGKVNNLSNEGVDLSKISDGTYIGECSVDYISAKVQVEVKSHEITNIEILEHINERGVEAESIIDEIVQQQTTKVDAVSSATNSSKVLKQAVEDALWQGMK